MSLCTHRRSAALLITTEIFKRCSKFFFHSFTAPMQALRPPISKLQMLRGPKHGTKVDRFFQRNCSHWFHEIGNELFYRLFYLISLWCAILSCYISFPLHSSFFSSTVVTKFLWRHNLENQPPSPTPVGGLKCSGNRDPKIRTYDMTDKPTDVYGQGPPWKYPAIFPCSAFSLQVIN